LPSYREGNVVVSAAGTVALRGPILYEHEGIALALTGRPRLSDQAFDPSSIAAKLAALYRSKGPSFLTEIRGPFSVAIVDAESSSVLLAVDRMAVESMCWTVGEDGLLFGSLASQVAAASARGAEINLQALYDFMFDHMVAGPDTAYVGVQKLLPATALRFDDTGVRIDRYWHPDFTRSSDVRSLEKRLLPLLEDAVGRTQPDDVTGCYLSGGLDSSTVTGVWAKLSSNRIKAFSVGFGVEGYDELEYARIAARHFGCEHHEYVVTPRDIVETIPLIAKVYDEPFGNSSVVPAYCCARFAKEHGVVHLLAGDGGDELFGGNERYVKQRVFELYNRVPPLLRRVVTEPLADHVDPEAAPLPFRKLSSYVRQARIPLPARYQTWNMIFREPAEKIFHPDLLASIDPQRPLRRMREVWDACPSSDLLDRMLWFDWKFTLADNDLRKVSRTAELAGIRVSYPMLDEALIDFSLRIPSDEKIKGRELRAFYKRAMRGFLPERILRKRKHGFGLPFGEWLKVDKALQDLVYGSLETLKARNIFAPSFLEAVVNEHRAGHPTYYGYAIWDLLMLEQWLQEAQTFARVPGK